MAGQPGRPILRDPTHRCLNTLTTHLASLAGELAVIEPEVLDRFQVDTVEMGRGVLTDPTDWKPWQLPDGTPFPTLY